MKKIMFLTGTFALLCLISCDTKKQEKEAATKFVVTNPIKIDTSYTKSYVAQIRSVRNIELRAQEKGFLQNIYVDEGQFVKQGQLLFRINPRMYESELLKTRAEEKAAEIELQNSKALADKLVVSKNELAMAQAKLEQAQAEVQLAQLHLSYTEIRAPFDGTIDRIPLKLGSLIEEGELLTSLSDNSEMYSYFNVSEPEYLDYQANVNKTSNEKVSLLLANNKLFDYSGKVEVIESEFDNETGNIAFRARFPNTKRLLKNGETGEVQMKVQF
jgi:membrane fusion protein (multidrug efflux system)